MKNFNIFKSIFLTVFIILISVSSCQKSANKSISADYVMFPDTLLYYAVTDPEDGTFSKKDFDVIVGATTTADYDRNFAVEIVPSKSNAIEGLHYKIENHNVTIKKGERTAIVSLKANYSAIKTSDSLVVCLKIVAPEKNISPIYNNYMRVEFVKRYPFNIDDFVGDILFRATFPFSSDGSVVDILTTAEKLDEKTIVVKGPINKPYDFILKFDNSDPLEPLVSMYETVAFVDINLGKVYARSRSEVPSYFDAEKKEIDLNIEFYVPAIGGFGIQYFYLKHLTPEEAEKIKNDIL